MEAIFWILFFLIIYHYFFFPILIIFFGVFTKRPIKTGDVLPSVSLVIAAYNEEKIIEKKIWNSLELDYPRDKLEIIIASDGSTDRTPQIVDGFKSRGIVGLYMPPRMGKTAALNRAVAAAQCEIVVFSDANSIYEPQAIKLLVRNFHDSSVGGVSGRKKILGNLNRESSRGDSLFWDFESKMKILQSRIRSITTGDGEIFAVRKALYQKIPPEVINDDMAISLNIIQKGYRVIYEPEAVSNEEASIVIEDDFNVKARMVAGGYQALALYAETLFSSPNFFAVQFFSHKVLRWAMPILLISLYIVNIFLIKGIYLYSMAGQTLFYLAAMAGYVLRRSGLNPGIFYFPMYYCSMNAAALVGLFFFLTRRGGTKIWKKAER